MTENVEPLERVTLSDQVFQTLHARVLSLELAPGTKISEAEISKSLGVSRQVVRDAFYRLSLLGFLIIRPQRATVVSKISASEIREARFLRTAIELETVRQACHVLSDADHIALQDLIEQQRAALQADDRPLFHQLDNRFHQDICARAGYGFAWSTIHEKKAHTDRVRFASLQFASAKALEGHEDILTALKARNEAKATAAIRAHLSEINAILDTLRAENHAWFAED